MAYEPRPVFSRIVNLVFLEKHKFVAIGRSAGIRLAVYERDRLAVTVSVVDQAVLPLETVRSLSALAVSMGFGLRLELLDPLEPLDPRASSYVHGCEPVFPNGGELAPCLVLFPSDGELGIPEVPTVGLPEIAQVRFEYGSTQRHRRGEVLPQVVNSLLFDGKAAVMYDIRRFDPDHQCSLAIGGNSMATVHSKVALDYDLRKAPI